MSGDNTIPEGYRMTELGLLPVDWEILNLGEMALEVNSGITPRGGRETYLKAGIPLIRSQNVQMNRLSLRDVAFISNETHQSMGHSAISVGDVLLNITGASIGRVCFVPKSLKVANVNQHVCKIRLKDNADHIFISYFLSSPIGQSQIMGSQYGTTRQGLNYGQVKSFRIPLPPLPEQKKTAVILSAIQESQEKAGAVIQAAKELKKSLMKHLFTYGPVSLEDAEHVPLKETEIGLIPEEWRAVKLGDVATLERGKFAFRPRNDPRFYGGNFPFIQTGDVSSSNGWIRTYSQTLNEKGLSVSRLFPKGTLVITIAANIGDVGILAFDSAFPDSLIGITPTSRINNVFLLYYLQTQKEKLNQIAPKSTQKNINLQLLRPYFTSLPPLPVQQKIADTLSSLDHKIEAEENKKKALEALFKTLLSNLMTGKIRVNHLEIAV
jgi:type I restriction enzyme S subunit